MNLLGAALYDPAGAVSKSTASLLAMTAFDTSNLRITATVPASGIVRVKMRCVLLGATTFPQILLGVLVGASVKGRQAPEVTIDGTALATTYAACDAEFTITGLTPGSTAFDAAYAVQTVVASTNIKYGGPNDATGADAWGGFLFEIWDPQPLPVAIAPGAANGLLIAGSNAATTFATLTSTGALSVNGVSAVSQTGDSFSRIGALGAGLTGITNVDIAKILGTAISVPATAGILDVNVKKIDNVIVNGVGSAGNPWGP